MISLSTHAEDLLRQCSIGWRISAPYRAICYLDVITNLVVSDVLPNSYLIDGLNKVEKSRSLIPIADWSHQNQAYLLRVQEKVEAYTFKHLGDVVPTLHTKSLQDMAPLNSMLRLMATNDVWVALEKALCVPSGDERRRNSKIQLQAKIEGRYQYLYKQVFGDSSAGTYDFTRFHRLAELIQNDYAMSKKLFHSADLAADDRRYDIPGMLFEIELTFLTNTLLDGIRQYGYSPDGANIEAALQLHQILMEMRNTLKKVANETIVSIDLRRLFEDNVDHWLDILEREAPGWIKNALKMDNLYESDENKHSTSANDLIVAFSQQVGMLQRIHWPDTQTKAGFITRFTKILSQSFEKYAISMEQAFVATLTRTQG